MSEQFWAKVVKLENGCWKWTGPRTQGDYGRYTANGRTLSAHRYAYELLVGPIPEGLQLDHICYNRLCVNPAHLEPVTPSENVIRSHKHNGKAPLFTYLTGKLAPNTCAACGYTWQPRTLRAPKECPQCKSRYWQATPATAPATGGEAR